ncbi:MAG: hypothetical protein V4473_01120 [Patescibacteria group bacterium]
MLNLKDAKRELDLRQIQAHNMPIETKIGLVTKPISDGEGVDLFNLREVVLYTPESLITCLVEAPLTQKETREQQEGKSVHRRKCTGVSLQHVEEVQI